MHRCCSTKSSSDKAYTAVVLQRWRDRVMEGRRDHTRYPRKIARRRGRSSARTQHKAGEDLGCSELTTRRKATKQLAAKEEREVCLYVVPCPVVGSSILNIVKIFEVFFRICPFDDVVYIPPPPVQVKHPFLPPRSRNTTVSHK